ncbi:uncharacterized protein LOC104903493 [Beta vulgaris subsp. vulgaris]|uniref:uncharacterized protein LOC104903493 n=1 Tax=Beta vulgaris subsp. vulgaris TaxID=3555 RepID=UPI0025492801|nr:uncharacterized protein LOC104903493 [Beta vulgaris subsp. vulgaris]XP_057248099.1 uncharacterized protein LOC104903493 [Beta vulgaris subsp. vulgaris]
MTNLNFERRFWCKTKPLFNPWRRRRRSSFPAPPLGLRLQKLNHFGKFDELVEENANLDWNTKRAALDASPYVVCLTSYIGAQRLFICSGTIVNSYAADGEFFSTILTSATLIRCPTRQDVVPDDIKVDVYLFDRSLCDGKILGLDFHYNVAAIRVKSDVQLQTAVMGNLDDYTECRARFGAASFHLPPHRDTAASRGLIALGRYHNHPCHIMAAPGKLV